MDAGAQGPLVPQRLADAPREMQHEGHVAEHAFRSLPALPIRPPCRRARTRLQIPPEFHLGLCHGRPSFLILCST
jgi:hypothetical protein